MISQKSIQDVLQIASIEDVVQEYVNLKRRGVNLLGLCPFHNEKTPSFTVSPAKNIFKCFGCGKGGNPVQFLMEHEQMSFPESIRFLAQKYNIELEETQKNEAYQENKLLADSLYLVNDFANNFFQEQMWQTDRGKSIALSYFKGRGFLESTIKKFQLGYCPDGHGVMYDALIKAKYSAELVIKLGLSKRENSDFFRARVMFPIHNLSGKIIGFGGRTLSQNKKAPKYLNSPDSEIYNKSKSLYGLYFAKNAIRQKDHCILVEGYTDTLSLHQAGIENVVASSGTSLTVDQLKLIKRYTENLTILYDGDAAGIKAAFRGMNLVLEQNMNLKLVALPEGHDPDSFLTQEGVNGFNSFIEKEAKDFVLFKIHLLSKESENDPIQKANLVRDILESVSKIPDTLKRASYIQVCSRLLEINEEILHKESNKIVAGDIKRKKLQEDRETLLAQRAHREEDVITEKKKPKQFVTESLGSLFHQEKDLARIAVEHGCKIYDQEENLSVIEFLALNLEDHFAHFENPAFSSIIQLAFQEYSKNQNYDTQFFTSNIDSQINQTAVELLSSPYQYANWDDRGSGLMTQKAPEKNQKEDVEKALYRYILKHIGKRIKHYKDKISELQNVENQEVELVKIFKIYQKLLEEKKNLSAKIETNLTYKI